MSSKGIAERRQWFETLPDSDADGLRTLWEYMKKTGNQPIIPQGEKHTLTPETDIEQPNKKRSLNPNQPQMTLPIRHVQHSQGNDDFTSSNTNIPFAINPNPSNSYGTSSQGGLYPPATPESPTVSPFPTYVDTMDDRSYPGTPNFQGMSDPTYSSQIYLQTPVSAQGGFLSVDWTAKSGRTGVYDNMDTNNPMGLNSQVRSTSDPTIPYIFGQDAVPDSGFSNFNDMSNLGSTSLSFDPGNAANFAGVNSPYGPSSPSSSIQAPSSHSSQDISTMADELARLKLSVQTSINQMKASHTFEMAHMQERVTLLERELDALHPRRRSAGQSTRARVGDVRTGMENLRQELSQFQSDTGKQGGYDNTPTIAGNMTRGGATWDEFAETLDAGPGQYFGEEGVPSAMEHP
ncbi:hypothetical protein TREMEDRAFT_63727 [Tremella mesenterica DSM 1558]|uniref:uncharacterized protein n=1 Tax=Tremella mesenterica (strain ATCC 24925 / CBS 8224 / DSM 1558 / NBRC 9311 / NRRL Y-6157 / RJB 2259-6 / UBC 559-6) TaxID=578456 RepID=UPI0003F4A0A7|nr:uncharacterized protein TREMEDRAFT_63727 [Tremella mesenterica DSM 1558]EIW67835.1 hypothetical protein TREMEDRAFT_63727 [Tremella mesenterica DSM 1558]